MDGNEETTMTTDATLAERGANPYEHVADMYKIAEVAWVKGELPIGQD